MLAIKISGLCALCALLFACGGGASNVKSPAVSSVAVSSLSSSASSLSSTVTSSSSSQVSSQSSSYSQVSSSSVSSSSSSPWMAIKKAFPGAEGFGAAASGGRGGDIYYVTSLEDTDTPGTLRYAINKTGKRVILFAVSGYIQLTKNLEIANGEVSILGQTAPGDGVTLRGAGLRIKEGTQNVVIRFIRSRPGQVAEEVDALDGRYLNNIIVDHSSFSWAIDETASLYASNNLTFQWNLVSESLNNAGHVKGPHGYGGNWGGVNTSFHHNLLAHHKSRSPRIDGILDKWSSNKTIPSVDGVCDVRNNLIYNHVQYPPYGSEGRDVQFINNYYKPGPASTSDTVKNFIVLASGRRPLYDEDRTATLDDYNTKFTAGTLDAKFIVNGAVAKPVGRVFVTGNFLLGNASVSANNVTGIRYDDELLKDKIVQVSAFPVATNAAVTTHSTQDAYSLILQSAGASLQRDSADARIVADVTQGTAAHGALGIIDSPTDVGGYPVLNTTAAPLDSDLDGMPDIWETANGLNASSANDRWDMFADLNNRYPEVKGAYTNAEVYWYSLVKHIPGAGVEASVVSANPLSGKTTPTLAESAAYVDGDLSLSFDTAPTLSATGTVKVYRALDDVLVDTIAVGAEQLVIGADAARMRTLKTQLIRVADKKLIVRLHADLAYNTAYYITVSNDLIATGTLAGKVFSGVAKADNWAFTTKAAAPTGSTVTVDDDGLADFRSLQAALNYTVKTLGKDAVAIIQLKNGTYQEPLFLRSKNNLTVIGESREGVVIQYTNNNTLNPGAGGSGVAGAVLGGRAVWLMESVDNLRLETFTLKNTTLIGAGGQAETIYFNSDQGRLIGKQINLISEQDTISLKGYNWFYQSLIAGNVDFIWGGNRVSLFEESEIRSLGDSRGNGGGGYVVQARTPTAADKGYVFLNSSFTRGAGPLGHTIGDGLTTIGRTGGASSFDSIALINCKVDAHIKTNAFTDTPSVVGSVNSGLRQYNTQNLSGAALNVSGWLSFYALSETEYQSNYATRAQIFSAYGSGAGWNPQ